MLKNKNEQGYAILLVIMLIAFIMIVSVSFVTASISNAKQERTVDTNNLAVIAAEMGIEYYINKLTIEEVKASQETFKVIQEEVNKYNECFEVPADKHIRCPGVKTIEQIKVLAVTKYNNELTAGLNRIKDEGATKVDGSNLQLTYGLKDYSLSLKDDILTINYTVEGISISSKKLVKAAAVLTLPKFVEVAKSNVDIPIIDPTIDAVFDYFSGKGNFKKEAACLSNNTCNDGYYSSAGFKEIGNLNNQNNVFWLHDGGLEIKNMNSMGAKFKLFVDTIITNNNPSMHSMAGKLLLLGKADGKGVLGNGYSIKFDNIVTGKVCINVDGFPKDQIEKIDFDNKNQVHFYSGSPNPIWPSNAGGSPKYTKSLFLFAYDCAFGPYYKTDPQVPSITVNVTY